MTAVTAVTDHTDRTDEDETDRTAQTARAEEPGRVDGTDRIAGTDRRTVPRAGTSADGGTGTSAGAETAPGPVPAPETAGAGTGADGHARVPDDNGPARVRGDKGGEGAWDDGLIARRAFEQAAGAALISGPPGASPECAPTGASHGNGGTSGSAVPSDRAGIGTGAVTGRPSAYVPSGTPYEGPLGARLDALRELVGLSRTRLDSKTLAEAGRVLDEAAARRRLSERHTVVAVAGATGSGKSTLFNALAGVNISEAGVRRPTTSAPIACSWSDGAAGLLDRIDIPGRLRRRPVQAGEGDPQLDGLVLIDLPDHDSAVQEHREQVDRILAFVDAVIWVVDPEKYGDAVLHERYLQPMAGHAEVTFVVLNQIDRLPEEAADQVLDDLRRLLDEDGIALGEHGEPGATVLALSALTGGGISDLRECLSQFTQERGAAARRIAADLDAAAAHLRPVYAAKGRVGLSEEAREEFADRLAEAVGAAAEGQAAERAWRRNAGRACGTPWLRLLRWYEAQRAPQSTVKPEPEEPAEDETTARQRVEQAVRSVAGEAASGLPAPWAAAVRESATRGSEGLPEALDALTVTSGVPAGRPPRPGWWPVAVLAQASMTLLQVLGGIWLLGQVVGLFEPNLGSPVLLMIAGIVGGPCVEWGSRLAARGPARRYGLETERRLREAAAGCGRARVLDPVAAELLRYREVREQYVRVTDAKGGTGKGVGVGVGVGTGVGAGSGAGVTELSTTGR